MAEIVCVLLMTLHSPSASISFERAKSTCMEVYRRADARGHDPIETAAQAGVESRWNATAVSPVGCAGPLQAQPRYFCPDRKPQGCDLLEAGLDAREKWQAWAERRWGRRPHPQAWLCGYAMGIRAPKRCDYAAKVLRLADRTRAALEDRAL